MFCPHWCIVIIEHKQTEGKLLNVARKTLEEIKAMTDEEVNEICRKEVEKVDSGAYKMIAIKKLKHEADFYLRYVVAHDADSKEFVRWMVNVESGGCHYGHYFNYGDYGVTEEQAKVSAMEDFKNS